MILPPKFSGEVRELIGKGVHGGQLFAAKTVFQGMSSDEEGNIPRGILLRAWSRRRSGSIEYRQGVIQSRRKKQRNFGGWEVTHDLAETCYFPLVQAPLPLLLPLAGLPLDLPLPALLAPCGF